MSWSRFKQILTYKAEWYGKKLILIDRFFPSSKTCSSCGYIKKDLTLNDRKWVCPECNSNHDRDLNAAKNIKTEGLKKLNLELTSVNSSLGMSLSEVTLMECSSLESLRSKKKIKIGKNNETFHHFS